MPSVWPARAPSSEGFGVLGFASATGGDTIGVAGKSHSDAGTGTLGWSAGDGTGVLGHSGPEPRPPALPMTGVYGHAAQEGGREGVFSGKSAQLRLVPASTAHPTSGPLGDLFLDLEGVLWLCKGEADWRRLA
jgi:hypothetical protein